jgi:hypothetical protein
VMQGKGIACSRVVRERRVPGDWLRFRDQVEWRSRQRRQMQRLANVASRIRTICMLVQQSATRREKKQRGACKQRQRPANGYTSSFGPHHSHGSTSHRSTFHSRCVGPLLETSTAVLPFT